MDIYILHDGKQIGPFSEGTAHQMLNQGVVLLTDPAWRPGMPEWIPLQRMLNPDVAPTDAASEFAPTALSVPEYATAKQRAFLNYMGIPFPADLSKEQAALLVNDAMEDPKNASRVTRWTDERLRLHPDIFAAEIQAKKEERPQHFFELCQTEGAEALDGVTKAHCQVLVGYLDVKFPNWDSGKDTDAAWNYFFPAVAEKFPQLVRPGWKEKLQYSTGPKIAPELKRRVSAPPVRPTTPKRKTSSSPIASLFKGLAFGLLLVGLAVGGLYAYYHPEVVGQAKTQIAALQAKLAKKASSTSEPGASATPAPMSQDTQSLFSDSTKTSTEGSTASMPPNTTQAQPAAVTPSITGTSTSETAMAGSAPQPALPEPSPATNDSNTSLFDPTPSSTNSTMAGDSAAMAALPPPKTTVTLTQTLELQLPYGKIKVPAGTQLPIVEQDGTNLKVRFQNQTVSVPASATDLGEGGLAQ